MSLTASSQTPVRDVPSVSMTLTHLASVKPAKAKCPRYQIDLSHTKKRDRMNNTLGQITDEIIKAVKAYHVASMGNDTREIAFAASEYQRMIREHGASAVDVAASGDSGVLVRWYCRLAVWSALPRLTASGAHFSCFTSTNVQILARCWR
jgi:hypothetical protein